MHSQFTKEFVNDIYLFYNNNVIVIRKDRRVKKSFKIFVKHTSLLFISRRDFDKNYSFLESKKKS